jgi:integrase
MNRSTAAGLGHVTTHQLRHTYTTALECLRIPPSQTEGLPQFPEGNPVVLLAW